MKKSRSSSKSGSTVPGYHGRNSGGGSDVGLGMGLDMGNAEGVGAIGEVEREGGEMVD